MKGFVYRNLGQPGVVYSVRDTKTGRVKKHKQRVVINDAELVVGQKGRERVRREGRKNVHAGIRGQVAADARKPARCVPVEYDPYKYDAFVRRDNKKPVHRAKKVHLGPKGACAVLPSCQVEGNFRRLKGLRGELRELQRKDRWSASDCRLATRHLNRSR